MWALGRDGAVGHVYAVLWAWRPENNLEESLLSFHCVDPGD